MLIRKLNDCEEFVAGDGTILRELLHPDKHPVALRYSFAQAIVPPGKTSIPHALATSEIYYILSGRGQMTIGDETQPLEPGDLVYIPPQARQFAHNPGPDPLVFICIVDPAWREADEQVFEPER
ncbi:MAG: cupin domain-containing protein [Synechococcales cyanobacterium RM1_1_8]|nr:cupin domain-containing protein [Synechococcales cyanobacterium RM1_1_8]